MAETCGTAEETMTAMKEEEIMITDKDSMTGEIEKEDMTAGESHPGIISKNRWSPCIGGEKNHLEGNKRRIK